MNREPDRTVPSPVDAPFAAGEDVRRTSAGLVCVGWFAWKEKAGRLLWRFVEQTLFRFSFRWADRWRAFLVRRFDVRIGRRPLIRSNAHVEIPWNLTRGDDSRLGERAIVYSLGPSTIGDGALVGARSSVVKDPPGRSAWGTPQSRSEIGSTGASTSKARRRTTWRPQIAEGRGRRRPCASPT